MQSSCVIINFPDLLLLSFLCYEFGFRICVWDNLNVLIFVCLICWQCICQCRGSVCGGWFLPLYLMTRFEIQRSYFKVKNFLVSLVWGTENSLSISARAPPIFHNRCLFVIKIAQVLSLCPGRCCWAVAFAKPGVTSRHVPAFPGRTQLSFPSDINLH